MEDVEKLQSQLSDQDMHSTLTVALVMRLYASLNKLQAALQEESGY